MTNSRNFFAELKRRNVYKVAITYAVVAWLLVQVASILFPTFEAPGWVMKIFITIVAAMFPSRSFWRGRLNLRRKESSERKRPMKRKNTRPAAAGLL